MELNVYAILTNDGHYFEVDGRDPYEAGENFVMTGNADEAKGFTVYGGKLGIGGLDYKLVSGEWSCGRANWWH